MVKEVTAVIRTKDRAESLKGTLDALRHQDYPSVHILVVDDHSVDNTYETCAKAGAEYVLNEGRGLVDAYNTGIKHVKAEWILLIDDDNVPDKECITKMSKYLRCADMGCVKTPAHEDLKENRRPSIVRWIRKQQRNTIMRILGTRDTHHSDGNISLGLSSIGNCSLLKKEAIEKVGEADRRCGRMHDIDTAIGMGKAGYRVLKLGEPLTHHIQANPKRLKSREFHKMRALNSTYTYKKNFDLRPIKNKILFAKLILLDITYMSLKAIFSDRCVLCMPTTLIYTARGLL